MGRVLAVLVAVSALAAAQPAPGADAGSQTRVIREALDGGRYADAEAAAEGWVRKAEAATGASSAQTAGAVDLLVEAYWRNGRASDRARAAAERAVALRRTSGASATALAVAEANLGRIWLLLGDYDRSIASLSDALRRDGEAPDVDALEIADDLGSALIAGGRLADAAPIVERARRAADTLDDDDPRVPRTLELQALLLHWRGEYATARPIAERALAIAMRTRPSHPTTADALAIAGDQRWFDGDLAGARNAYEQALALAERTLRPDHPALTQHLKNLALAVDALGDVARARALRERGLALAERSLGATHPAVADQLNDLAASEFAQANYPQAQTLYERSLRLVEKRLGPTHLEAATRLNNLSLVHAALGDPVEARRLHDRAVAIWQRRLGPDHPFIARADAALAQTFLDQGLASQAVRFFERALAIRERTLGRDHPDVGVALEGLAAALLRTGALARADDVSARALDLFNRAGDDRHAADALWIRADVLRRAGRFDDARQRYEQSLDITRRIDGPLHPRVADTEARLALTLGAAGDRSAAVKAALDAEQGGRDHLRAIVRYLPERQSLAYAATRPRALDLALSMIDADSPSVASVYDAEIRSRGIILDELGQRARDEGHGAGTDALADARQRYANLLVRSLAGSVPRRLLEDARDEKETAERAFAAQSVEAQADLSRASFGLESARTSLPPAAALVSFVEYERTSMGSRERMTRAYAAFVLGANHAAPTFIPLGAAATIDALIRRWQAEASGGSIARGLDDAGAERAYRAAADALRRAIWDPVAKAAPGTSRFFVVPDGLLNVVNIAALTTGGGRYLVESDLLVHYLSTERDLVEDRRDGAASRSLVAVGGPAFGPDRTTATSGAGGGCALRFGDLPGARAEATEIASLWSEATRDSPVVLVGAKATETAVKQQLGGHRVLHLATHGFFLSGSCGAQRPVAGTRAVGAIVATAPPQAATAQENPLQLAGLALAGANRRPTRSRAGDDGVLTAEEIAGLNLQGTEWAVLSACDTGLGEIRAGEGVFGLRRAFQIAGARTVIMSLWAVDDQATRLWMRALYDGRLRRNLDTADAVKQASLTVLRQRRAAHQSTHPFYWAAFVAAGDWR